MNLSNKNNNKYNPARRVIKNMTDYKNGKQ